MRIMKQKYILYNPLAGSGFCKEEAEVLDFLYSGSKYMDVTKIENYGAFFQTLDASDEVILCGGDGTLNRFVNHTMDLALTNTIYYYPLGNENNFAHDLGLSSDEPLEFRMNDYFRGLPSVSFHGKERLFLNNVGFGIDGCCCEEGERLRREYIKNGQKKNANFTIIALKELLFRFKPRNASITVDGTVHHFKKIWLAPTMYGRYCSGGMMAAPDQDRLNPDRTLTIMVMHGAGRLKALCMLPSIFKGKHTRYKKHVTMLVGHEITVEFDAPAPLQIDGETIPDVREYRAKSAKHCFFERNASDECVLT